MCVSSFFLLCKHLSYAEKTEKELIKLECARICHLSFLELQIICIKIILFRYVLHYAGIIFCITLCQDRRYWALEEEFYLIEDVQESLSIIRCQITLASHILKYFQFFVLMNLFFFINAHLFRPLLDVLFTELFSSSLATGVWHPTSFFSQQVQTSATLIAWQHPKWPKLIPVIFLIFLSFWVVYNFFFSVQLFVRMYY